jgi:membrane protease YdiL (CAAX protease family)
METTQLPTRSSAASGGLFEVLRRHPLIGYFGLAYGFTWIYVLLLLIRPGLPFIPAIIAPTAAALIMTAVTGGRTGIGQLLRYLVRWRVGISWYLFVLVGIPLVYLLGAIVVAGGRLPDAPSSLLLRLAQSYPIGFAFTFLTGGPLFEEPGWRGFALPRLQHRYRALVGSLILGALWVLWHVPMFLVPGFAAENGGLSLSGIGVFLLTALAFTVIMTWVFNHTRGSLLLAILLHTSLNIFQPVVNLLYPNQAHSEVNGLIGFGVLALILVVVTRSRLGYRDAEPPAAEAVVVR